MAAIRQLHIKMYWNNSCVFAGTSTVSMASEMVRAFMLNNFSAVSTRVLPDMADLLAIASGERQAPLGGQYEDKTGAAGWYIERAE